MLRASRPHHISPFLLFVKRRRVPSMTFALGQSQRKQLGEMWKRLPAPEKSRYRVEAHRITLSMSSAKNAHQRNNPTHQSTDYNLVMKLLFAPPFDNFLSGEMAGRIAKNTVQYLNDDDRRELRKSFGVEGVVRERRWNKREYEEEVQLSFVPTRFCDPSRYSSFTEMVERALGSEAKQIFSSIAILKSGMRYTRTFEKVINSEWNALPSTTHYNPIAARERKFFEKHCASKALVSTKDNKIDIYTLFCQFREILPNISAAQPPRNSRGTALLKSDRRHDVYERVLSTMSSLDSTRASDYARDAVQRKALNPSSYAVVPSRNVQNIAESIAMERVDCCVYDEVISRYGELMPNNAVAKAVKQAKEGRQATPTSD